MTKEEKILLLELILQDIRGNWGYNLEDRIYEALALAKELELEEFIASIEEYDEQCDEGNEDGRFFRMDYKSGGYMGMEKLHGLSYTVMDKSLEFKSMTHILTYPENRFEDWEEYEARLK